MIAVRCVGVAWILGGLSMIIPFSKWLVKI